MPLSVPVAEAQGTTTYTEDFEDDALYYAPSENWYTFSKGGDVVADVRPGGPSGSTQALRVAPAALGSWVALTATFDFCDAAYVEFDWKAASHGASVEPFTGLSATKTSGPGANQHVGMHTDGIPNLQGSIQTTTVVVKTAVGAAFTPETWYKIRIQDLDCANGSGRFFRDGAGPYDFDAAGSIGGLTHFLVAILNNDATTTQWVDNLVVSGAPYTPPPTPTVGADETYAASVFGFDVDTHGNSILYRETWASGGAMKRIDARNMASGGSFSDATRACNVLGDGLHNTGAYMVYKGCGAAANVVDALVIRDTSMNPPSVSGCNSCKSVFEGAEFDQEIANAMQDLHSSSLYGMGSGAGQEEISYVWSYTTNTGKAGLLGIICADQVGGVTCSSSDKSEVSYGTAPVTDSCYGRRDEGTAGTPYMLLASTSQATKIYDLDSLRNVNPGYTDTIEVNMNQLWANSGTWGQAKAVACQGGVGNNVLVAAGGNVGHINAFTGATTKSYAYNALEKGVAISGDGKFAAVATATETFILNLTSQTEVAKITNPAGTFVGVEMDYSGSMVWLGYSDAIHRFIVNPYTCLNSCSIEGGGEVPGVPTVIGTGGGVSGGVVGSGSAMDPTALGDAMGVSASAAGWFLGILLVVGIAVGLAFFGVWMGVLGGILGMGLAVTFGLIPMWFLLVLILLGTATVVLWFRGRGD